ncbi:hypothetical protein BAZSYMA_ACONTIG69955_0 [Bathymodiolus azoricus thioautotrophic gill symbiont]|uniref:Uncharacterized protein n=1 Tax=Bathymodiolus azoricus thioautotrophic gill symbiont TaxID=235205 RepID=A0A1H6KR04_9GAMM|nr:hypothetical protein BAZSYMA_ACONTIG69955_0 [Bathymodiolus azoricus thioautotrophic gill symbiont]
MICASQTYQISIRMKSEKLLIGNEKEIVLLIICICYNEF